jgi:hypothetical protein
MTKLLIAFAVICAVCLPAWSAEAAEISTFSGSCVGSGLVRTGAPLTAVPVLTSIEFTSTGTCTGILDGRAVRDAPFVGRSASPSALLSCEAGQVSGDTVLSINEAGDRWTTLHLRFDDLNVLGTSGFTLRGVAGGLALGMHQMAPDLAVAAACLGGGVDEVGTTVSLATITPFRG